MDESMCWLGAGEDVITLRLYEPVVRSGGTVWAYVPRAFAEAAVRAWSVAAYRVYRDQEW